MRNITVGPPRGRSRVRRIITVSRVAAILSVLFVVSGCDPIVNYWALNDSDRPVTFNVLAGLPFRKTIPPHSYAGLTGGIGTVGPGWRIDVVDGDCRTLQTIPMKSDQGLVYVAPDGHIELTDGAAYMRGLRTAKSAPAPTTAPCPRDTP